MSGLDEASFRELLDERGVLKASALAAPARHTAYTVFGQRSDAACDMAALNAKATRFFGAKLGLTVDKRYGGYVPTEDAARIVLASDDGTTSGTRLCFIRPADDDDLAAAEEAERRQRSNGMALLAQRCKVVWLVVLDTADDRVALTLAAILASHLLGPILSPTGDELFGVRTARTKLERLVTPYRA